MKGVASDRVTLIAVMNMLSVTEKAACITEAFDHHFTVVTHQLKGCCVTSSQQLSQIMKHIKINSRSAVMNDLCDEETLI